MAGPIGASPALVITPQVRPALVVVGSGGPSGPPGPISPGLYAHAWIVQGIVLPEEMMGFPVWIENEEKEELSLIGAITVLNSGTKLVTELFRNKEAIPGVSSFSVEPGTKKYSFGPVKLKDKDYITIKFKTNEGNSAGVSFAVFTRYKSKE